MIHRGIQPVKERRRKKVVPAAPKNGEEKPAKASEDKTAPESTPTR